MVLTKEQFQVSLILGILLAKGVMSEGELQKMLKLLQNQEVEYSEERLGELLSLLD